MEQDCKKLCFQDEHCSPQPLPDDHHWISCGGAEVWEVLIMKIQNLSHESHLCDMFNL